MPNLSIKVNLQQLSGAFLFDFQGQSATKRCIVIPIEDANLFLGQKGCYLNLTAIETQNSQYGDTHIVKQNLDRAVYDRMTEEQRRAMPIIGSVKILGSRQNQMQQPIPQPPMQPMQPPMPSTPKIAYQSPYPSPSPSTEMPPQFPTAPQTDFPETGKADDLPF